MSVEMIAPEMNADAGPPAPPEEPPKQEAPQKAAKRTWICKECGVVIHWLPDGVAKLDPSLIRCKKCQKAFEAAEAAKANTNAPPPPAHEAPKRADKHAAPKHAAPQRRPAGPPPRRAQAPRELTLEVVELCAFRSGIAPPQVEALLAALRSHMKTPSSDK